MDPALFNKNAEVESTHWWFAARRRIMQSLLGACIPASDGRSVVDVGCGTGANIAALAGNYTCAGIDPTPAAIEHAERRFPDVRFSVGHAPAGLDDEALRSDGFLLMDVLEHVEDDEELLASLVAVMPVDSYLFITVPADMRLWTEHDVSHGHFRRYDPGSLRSLWAGLPVEEVVLSPFNSRLYPVVRLLRFVSRRRGHGGGEAGSDLKAVPGPLNRILLWIFGGETRRLRDVLAGKRRPYLNGVSLVAMLKRLPT